ncbi:Ada metal-binding domain-containing protein [Streptomyces sp. NRRL S-87]|uniref:Ada metal-binding domain-containing protein n=1 Tax=Streptomyces sp. NRRL S-87 TaxID=1463920 RepID=UPI000A5C95D1|nr:Ada metal-binding domain-containing protein [Streptomyces sp. NRRL S-87]
MSGHEAPWGARHGDAHEDATPHEPLPGAGAEDMPPAPVDFALRILQRVGVPRDRYDTYVSLDTPAGALFVAFTPERITGSALGGAGLTAEGFEELHRARTGRSAIPARKAFPGLATALRTARARALPLDLGPAGAPATRVLAAVRTIPPGQLRPMSWIAHEAGTGLPAGPGTASATGPARATGPAPGTGTAATTGATGGATSGAATGAASGAADGTGPAAADGSGPGTEDGTRTREAADLTERLAAILASNPLPVLVPCHRVTYDNGAPCDAGYLPAAGEALRRAEGIDMAEVRQWSRSGAVFLGSDTTHIYCHPTCAHARRITPPHRVPFASAGEAHRAGYRACKSCRPVAV